MSSADYNSHCTNSSGVSASFVGGAQPNGTSGSASGTASGGTASSTSKAAGAQKTMMAGWALGAIGVMGGLAAL
jgi:hypothetical protein